MCIVCCSVNAVDAAFAVSAAENVVKSVPKAIIPSQSFFLPYLHLLRSSMMDIHAGRFFIASADHTQELPSISFVEPGMVGQKIQRIDPHRRHVIADILEKKARDPLVSEFFVHIDCAYIGRILA